MKDILFQNIRLLLAITLLPTLLFAQKAIETVKLKPSEKINIAVPEPSDLCISLAGDGFYIVSDNGYLFETDKLGKIIKKADFRGTDFEAVWTADNKIFVSDESLRKIEVFNADLTHAHTYSISVSGGRNEGVEAGTYNATDKTHLLFTEKNPARLMLFSDNFGGNTAYIEFPGIKEVSSCTFFEGSLWILSDEERIIYKTDYPKGKNIIAKYSIPVLNPEGICFLPDGTLVIASDDLYKLFIFKLNAE
jgi:uncharacterized protein YjiK